MAAALEMTQHHHAAKMADMTAVGRGVDTQIGRRHFFIELLFGAGHDGMYHAAPCEFFDEVHEDVRLEGADPLLLLLVLAKYNASRPRAAGLSQVSVVAHSRVELLFRE